MENVTAAANIPIFTAKTARCTMQYFRFGTGEKTMVILPGLAIQSVMGSAQAVAEAYKDFAADYTVYLFDRRMDLPEDYPVREMAKDTAEVFICHGLSCCRKGIPVLFKYRRRIDVFSKFEIQPYRILFLGKADPFLQHLILGLL